MITCRSEVVHPSNPAKAKRLQFQSNRMDWNEFSLTTAKLYDEHRLCLTSVPINSSCGSNYSRLEDLELQLQNWQKKIHCWNEAHQILVEECQRYLEQPTLMSLYKSHENGEADPSRAKNSQDRLQELMSIASSFPSMNRMDTMEQELRRLKEQEEKTQQIVVKLQAKLEQQEQQEHHQKQQEEEHQQDHQGEEKEHSSTKLQPNVARRENQKRRGVFSWKSRACQQAHPHEEFWRNVSQKKSKHCSRLVSYLKKHIGKLVCFKKKKIRSVKPSTGHDDNDAVLIFGSISSNDAASTNRQKEGIASSRNSRNDEGSNTFSDVSLPMEHNLNDFMVDIGELGWDWEHNFETRFLVEDCGESARYFDDDDDDDDDTSDLCSSHLVIRKNLNDYFASGYGNDFVSIQFSIGQPILGTNLSLKSVALLQELDRVLTPPDFLSSRNEKVEL
jgi:hypothetical protein